MKKQIKKTGRETMNMNEYSIQKVAMIRYKRAYYHPIWSDKDEFSVDYEETMVYELTEEGITSYIRKKGSRKKQDRAFIKVNSAEMRSLIDSLQDYSRKATDAFVTIDDCSHEVQFIYPGEHKEIFRLDVSGQDDATSLVAQIMNFVYKHQKEKTVEV